MLYLQDKLSEEKKHEVEKKLMENEFANDALEGLQQFKDKKQISLYGGNAEPRPEKESGKEKTAPAKTEAERSTLVISFVYLLISLFLINHMI